MAVVLQRISRQYGDGLVARRYIDVFEAFDRFSLGERIKESDWDYKVIPENAKTMKKRYDLDFDGKIIPEDQDMVDRLFLAGVDMLLTTGFYNRDLGKSMMIDEDEIYEGLKMAPKSLRLGSGKDECECKARRGNSTSKPIIQGGPTGAPLSDAMFEKIIESYAQEPAIDAIVSGVLNTVDEHYVVTNSPWEIKATIAEIRYVREATASAGRPGMCI